MSFSLISQFSKIQLLIIRYEEPVILVLGNIGNTVNIWIFLQRDLRKNVCSWYFISLSIAHLLLLDSFCLPRIIITSTGDNVFRYISILCKLRAYATELTLLLSRYFLCLISIDRWMVTSSNAWIRQQSSSRVARWLIIIGIAFFTISSLHAAIGYQTNPVECTPPFGSTYEFFVSVESIIASMTPMLIMSIFSLLTVFNVRSRLMRQIQPTKTDASRSQIQSTVTSNAQFSYQRFKGNMQLVRLSLLQVTFYLMLNSVWSIIPLYSFLAGAQAMMNINQQMMTLFLGRIGLNLLFTYASITFILYTLASKSFRQACIVAIKQLGNTYQRRF
ncbi:unnamed protein product [Rotaria sp. Silwood2]|nr:unnamed protein product [Rotaria sp. Silwood2]